MGLSAASFRKTAHHSAKVVGGEKVGLARGIGLAKYWSCCAHHTQLTFLYRPLQHKSEVKKLEPRDKNPSA